MHYLGRFNNDFDAAIKYDEASRSHKGDRSIPNFVEMTPLETQQLRQHYFANGHTISSEFERFLFTSATTSSTLVAAVAAAAAPVAASKPGEEGEDGGDGDEYEDEDHSSDE